MSRKVCRSFNADRLADAVEPFLPLEGFHPAEWLERKENIALTDGEGSYALFEFVKPGIYYGHYFFHKKGKEAARLSEEFLSEIFQTAKIVVGLTPVEKKAARWMSRHIGFKSQGIVDTDMGPHEMFMMTKEEFNGLDLRQEV